MSRPPRISVPPLPFPLDLSQQPLVKQSIDAFKQGRPELSNAMRALREAKLQQTCIPATSGSMPSTKQTSLPMNRGRNELSVVGDTLKKLLHLSGTKP
jgi:hypothetical protein